VVRTNFSVDFWTFCNFDRNISKIVLPPSDGNKNYLAVLKGQSHLKRGENGLKIGPYTATQ